MKPLMLSGVAVVIFMLQLSFIPALRPFGVVPNAGLVLVALVGLYGTASLALIIAVAGGLTLDLVSGANFGLYVALFTVVALAAGYIHRAGLNWVGPSMAIGLVIVATLVQNFIILGGLLRVTSSWPLGYVLGQTGLELILNTFLVLVLRPLVQWLLPTGRGELEIDN
ncbi:hypothetical protein HJC99_04745 [Candidatus Saccharibacteria bacterium]|nr:hypothetical protein [Candidatus Saccharibacteria bacterium]